MAVLVENEATPLTWTSPNEPQMRKRRLIRLWPPYTAPGS
jgi:hypothetical protein